MVVTYLLTVKRVVSAQPYLNALPSRHKAIASELVAVAASIATARCKGDDFLGARSEVNSWFGYEIWSKPWKGGGPDYLLTDLKSVTFMEVKGMSQSAPSTPADLRAKSGKKFFDYKTQSVNACVLPALPTNLSRGIAVRHLLSVVYSPAGGPVVVHWFNQRTEEAPLEPAWRVMPELILAVVLSNLKTQLANYGVQTEMLQNVTELRRLGEYCHLPPTAEVSDLHRLYPEQLYLHGDVLPLYVRMLELFAQFRTHLKDLPVVGEGVAQRPAAHNKAFVSEARELLREFMGWYDRNRKRQPADALRVHGVTVLAAWPTGFVVGARRSRRADANEWAPR